MDADHVVRLDRNWTSFLEVVRDEAQPTDHDWAAQITSTAAGLFTTSSGLCMTIVEHAPDLSTARSSTLIADARMRDMFNMSDAGIRYLGVEKFREYYYPRHIATTHQEIERAFDRDYREQAAAMRRGAGFSDALGLILHPDPGIVIVLFALHERPIVLDRTARTLLTRLGLHIETAYRLRRRGSEIVKAILDRDGRVLFTAPGMPSRDALDASAQTSIRQLRAVRDRKGSLSAPDAIALWPALIAGHLSLVERRIDGQPRYLLVENAPSTQPFRALSKQEVDVVSHAARGLSTKLIAYALGISTPSISANLSSAATKIGTATRIELVRLAAMLTRDPRARFVDFKLSEAERDVLDLIQRGLTNEEIASKRSRSIRTIANQVSSLLRKTKTTSRRDLVRVTHAERS